MPRNRSRSKSRRGGGGSNSAREDIVKMALAMSKLAVGHQPRSSGGRSKSRGRTRSRSRSRPRQSGGGGGPMARQPSSTSVMGNSVIEMREPLGEVVTVANATSTVVAFPLGINGKTNSASFPFLQKLCKLYDRMRWTYVTLEWVPVASATTSGTAAIGMDWGKPQTFTNFAQVSSLSPNVETAVYQKAWLRLPKQRLNAVNWYPTDESTDPVDVNNLGSVTIAVIHDNDAKAKSMGFVYIQYCVELSGANTTR